MTLPRMWLSISFCNSSWSLLFPAVTVPDARGGYVGPRAKGQDTSGSMIYLFL